MLDDQDKHQKTDFEWREASPRRAGVLTAFFCGVVLTAAAAFYVQQARQDLGIPAIIPPTKTAASAPEISTQPAAAVTVAEEEISKRRDTTAVFADPEPENSEKNPDDALNVATPTPSGASAPTEAKVVPTTEAPQLPIVINRDSTAKTEPQPEPEPARPAVKADPPPAKPKPNRTVERRLPDDQRYEPPSQRRQPDYGPPVDPGGRDSGYWNGRDFN